ncbi:hypothetical protein FRB91_010699 [Serendipita sp. 411]|nr:hypothetical protein FRB91_010699 [Serendipita sp. 411]
MEEMDTTEAVGISNLFLLVPLLCVVSIACCMLILPGFVKTRVFVLIFYVSWLILGCALIAVNMCIWRNNTRSIPIYGDIVSRIWAVYHITLYLTVSCFNKFVWNITKPAPSLRVYDARTEYNRIDAFICIGLSVLWSPIILISNPGRYTVLEDLGPWILGFRSLIGFFANVVPMGMATLASVVFSILTSLNLSRSRQWKHGSAILGPTEPHQRLYRDLGTSLVWRYWILSVIGVVETIFGFLWSLYPWLRGLDIRVETQHWYTIFELKNNIRQLPLVYSSKRREITESGTQTALEVYLITLPLIGIQLFLLFGLGSEARQRYRSWLSTLCELLAFPKAYRWLERHVRRVQWRRGWAAGPNPENFTPFRPDDIAMEPYIATMPPRNEGHPSIRKVTDPRPIPVAAPRSSKRSQLRNSEALPSGPSERWRTFHKIRVETPPTSLDNGGRIMRKEPLPPSLVPMTRR